MTPTTYNPTNWLPTLFRAIHDFVLDEINKWIEVDDVPSGLQAYEIVFDFPPAVDAADKIPFRNEQGKPVTLIHFAVDDIDNMPLGIGESIISETVDEDEFTVVQQEAERHTINFDVGIWATDASGGSTSRLVAYQMLSRLFGTPSAREHFQTVTGGIDIISFRGGRFIQETINDIRIFRTIDSELIVRAYSHNDVLQQTLVGEVEQNSGLIIGDEIIIDVEP